MSVIFDHRGSGHNLALGAFDTQSIAKIGNASVLLSKYLPQTFDKSFGELISEYQFDLAKSEPSMLGKLWTDYMKPGLKHVGAQAWELTQGFAGDVIKGLIGTSSPTAALAVAAGEAILTTALGGYLEGMIPDTKSISLKRGQWLFIEDKNHLKRRLAHQTEQTGHRAEGSEQTPESGASRVLCGGDLQGYEHGGCVQHGHGEGGTDADQPDCGNGERDRAAV